MELNINLKTIDNKTIDNILKQLKENSNFLSTYITIIDSLILKNNNYNIFKKTINDNEEIAIIGYEIDKNTNIYNTKFPININNNNIKILVEYFFEGVIGIKKENIWETAALIPNNNVELKFFNEKEEKFVILNRKIYDSVISEIKNKDVNAILYDMTLKKAYSTKYNPEKICEVEKNIFKRIIHSY